MTSLRKQCKFDMGIPYDPPVAPTARLLRISQYMQEHGLSDAEFDTASAAHLLEEKVAGILGTEGAIWFPTGTMAQGAVTKIYTSKHGANSKVLLHPTSHLLLHEEDGYKHLYKVDAQIEGSWYKAMDESGINEHPACMFIEFPQRHSGGVLPSWQALQNIKDKCSSLGVGLHMDGARLWACRSFYENRNYRQILQGFDSVYVSFYKDIGAIGGAMLLGNQAFIQQAKLWRTRLGGFSPGSWPMIIDTLSVIDHKLEQMPTYVKKAQNLAASIENLDVQCFPSRPHINMFHLGLPFPIRAIELARAQVAEQYGVWLSDRIWEVGELNTCAMEFVVGEQALQIPEEQFQCAIEHLLDALNSHT